VKEPIRGLFTVPAGVPFLDALAGGVLARWGDDPAALSAGHIFLPTRRACQAMTDAFLRASNGKPLLLPKLEPLGDLDPEDWHAPDSAATAAAALLPPIGQTRRQLLLARLILQRGGSTPDQALKLAEALGGWLDQVQIHQLDPAELAGLVPDEYAAHWADTLEFLRIVTEFWPAILVDEGVMDPVARRQAVVEAQIAAWQASPPGTPVIAAGSTGSLPATAALMRAVLELPQGAVVLPGLDSGLPEEAWSLLPEGHPQHGLGRLLASLERSPASVEDWPHDPDPDRHKTRVRHGRKVLLRHALMPADCSEPLPNGSLAADGLEGIVEVAAAGPEAEARVIGLRLRKFLNENATGTAALITADRGLAKRVAAELTRWQVAIDDSAGEPLGETPPGVFLRLVAEATLGHLAPVPLLSLLKHPLTGVDRSLVETLERHTLHGIRPAPGIEGLRQAVPEKAAADLEPLLVKLETALSPLAALAQEEERIASLEEWITVHVQAAEALAATEETPGADRLWAEEAGEAAAQAIDGLMAAAADFPDLPARDYPAVFEELTARQTMRPRYGKHPRLAILGPLEARLQCPDLAILGGLNEGSWPPEPEHDPWMGRPMRKKFGLPLPEWRIGLAAHDFCQAIAAPEVMLTRAERVAGTPTVPSRWLARLELAARQALGLTGKDEANPLRAGGRELLEWQEAIDRPETLRPPEPPAPAPPVEARFSDLSVTAVERWVGDPYGHYARTILKLRALDPVDQQPDASERGSILHDALHRFIQSLGPEWPDNAEKRLIDIGRCVFSPYLERPAVRAFWWPRFLKMARWFVETERERRQTIQESRTEHKVAASLAFRASPVELSAKMDRIDRQADGTLLVIDYKSGSLPEAKRIAQGWPPQLPLEAALLQKGECADVNALEAWAVGGSGDGGEVKRLTAKNATVEEAAAAAWEGVHRLLDQFADPAMPYLAEPRPALAPRYSDYRHLARIDREGDHDG